MVAQPPQILDRLFRFLFFGRELDRPRQHEITANVLFQQHQGVPGTVEILVVHLRVEQRQSRQRVIRRNRHRRPQILQARFPVASLQPHLAAKR